MPPSSPRWLRSTRVRIVVGALLVGVAAGGWWLRDDTADGAPIADGDAIVGVPGTYALAQGWTQQTRERASFASFGSRLLPYDWFLALESPGSAQQAFRSNAHLRQLGFLVAAPSASNPDGLPVGMARARDERGRFWLGFGCAACHTGELRYRGRAIRIAGGAGRIDLSGFERELLASMQQTAAEPQRFARFARRVQAAGSAASLRAELEQRARWLQARVQENATAVPYGHGRMDAFGQIFNAVGVDMLGIPANVHAPDAPVSIPVLWSTPRMARVQWNGSSPNDGIAPLVQNVTTALGVYGQLDASGEGGPGYSSSADVAALGDMQRWNGRLRAPRWPPSLLGPVDAASAARGAVLYAANCQGCHALPGRAEAGAPVAVKLVPVEQVGTDARAALNFARASGATGALRGRPALVYGGAEFGERARMIDLVVHLAVGATARHPLLALGAVAKGRQAVGASGEPGPSPVYKARPLDGAWSSAPYLHNGSVPSLHDLLLPPAQRPRRFLVGDVDFDPRRVGLAPGPAGAGTSAFDAGLPGNGNGGHLYGTNLSEPDRQDLLAFLKGL